MTNFEKWDKEFRAQNMYVFNNELNGLLWLKVRAICRGKQIKQFLESSRIELISTTLAEQNIELFELLENRSDAFSLLDSYLKVQNHEWYSFKNIDESQLKEDLYKIQHYVWGGDQNNSLDKYLVSKYVKEISRYGDLERKQVEIAHNAWNYVQTSWYNNWTSYLIESLFKHHRRVVSAVGEIKSVDFFIDNNPIDLKVTFFPVKYMEEKLKQKLGKKELSWLKKKAKEVGITVDESFSDSQKMYALLEKLQELGHSAILNELKTKRKEVVDDARANTMELMTWLYTNQGEMRFGSENRLFLILVDTTDMAQSWKMKRAFSLIEPRVNEYLDNFNSSSLKEISFTFKKNHYRSLADVLFVVKE